MLKKYISAGLSVVLVLSLAGCNLPGSKNAQQSGQAGTNTSQPEVTPAPKSKTESYTFKALKAAIELGIPLKCSYKINNVSYEGYVKGKQWRGKINTGQGMVGEIIMKDNCLYSWEEGKTQGMKTCFDKDVWDTNQQGGDQNIEYICAPALVDDSQFVPPTNINFQDLSQLEQQGVSK
jgi:hypothetical protein